MANQVVICPVTKQKNTLELFRGGILSLARWFIAYPLAYFSYNIKGLQRSPWRMNGLGDGPGIIVCNHSNALFDFLLAQVGAPQWCFAVFSSWPNKVPGFAFLLKLFRILPFFRRNIEKKEQILENLALLLNQGNWLLLFPEGHAECGTKVRPLKYGVARVALQAEKNSGWALPLKIYVLGLNYEKPEVIGSMCIARWAQPINVKDYYESYKRDPMGTELLLLNDIRSRFQTVVFNSESRKELEDAFRLAMFRAQGHFSGIEKALIDLQNDVARPIEFIKIKCSRTETIVYQFLGLSFFRVFFWLASPFRLFARLCSSNKSQEAEYIILLWFLCLAAGFLVSQWNWILGFLFSSILVTRSWLWAWRRGIVR